MEKYYKAFFNILWKGCEISVAMISEVEQLRHKLKHEKCKPLIYPKEKSLSLLIEIIGLFTPQDRNVLEMHGGTMSTCIAVIRTSRKFIAIEKDEICFKLAVSIVQPIPEQIMQIKFLKDRMINEEHYEQVAIYTQQSFVIDGDDEADEELPHVNAGESCDTEGTYERSDYLFVKQAGDIEEQSKRNSSEVRNVICMEGELWEKGTIHGTRNEDSHLLLM